jgi:hypothetical protein
MSSMVPPTVSFTCPVSHFVEFHLRASPGTHTVRSHAPGGHVEDGPSGKLTHEIETALATELGRLRGGGDDVDAIRERHGRQRVVYLVLPNPTEPFLLARVRWPDVYQAISPVRPDWQDDPGLFDLPYAPTSTAVTYDEASEIAAGWGARLPSDEEDHSSGPSLIRRMPSDWSNLSTAERRAWSIVARKPARHAVATPATVDPPAGRAVPPASRGRRWGRRRVDPVLVKGAAAYEDPISDRLAVESLVVDLTEPTEAARATVDQP